MKARLSFSVMNLETQGAKCDDIHLDVDTELTVEEFNSYITMVSSALSAMFTLIIGENQS